MRFSAVVLVVIALMPPAMAQSKAPVGYSTAVEHAVRSTARFPGSVESRRTAIVATEVAGLVVSLDVLPGDRVEADQELAGLRRVFYEIQLRAADGQLRESRARLDLAESNLRRARELFDDDVISHGELDDAISESAAWQARVDQSLAAVDRAKVGLDRCRIPAPFAGVVTSKLTEIGEWIDQGGPVVEMVSLDDLEVRVEVPERWFGGLERNTSAEVTFEALPGLTLTGHVREIVPRADPQSRSFPVKVRIDANGRRIGVGMLATVSLPVGGNHTGLIVPKDAVVRLPGEERVFVIDDDDTVRPVSLTSVQGVGDWVAVEGPISAGDRVVTRGNERLRPGQAVEATLQEYALP